MNYKILSVEYNNKIYRVHNLFGFLLEYECFGKGQIDWQDNIHLLFQQVLNPYLLVSSQDNNRNEAIPKESFYIKFLAQIFTFLCLRSFLFVRLLSNFHLPIFNSTKQAIDFYRKLYPKE